jgi:hypothetical protein
VVGEGEGLRVERRCFAVQKSELCPVLASSSLTMGKGEGRKEGREDYLPFDRSPELDEADA